MATTRQHLGEILREQSWGFEELRRELRLTPRELEDELAHLERSLRRSGGRIAVEPARCRGCDRELVNERRPFHVPGRCHRCRAERISPPSFHIPS